MNEKLNLTTLIKATDSFKTAIDEYNKDESNDFVRDSCIQRFEYCYDLTTKMIKRYLSTTSENPSAINEMSFQEIIREAYTKGVLKNSWDKWWEYRDDRNATSHGYDKNKAIEIVKGLRVFYLEIAFFLERLKDIYEDQV